MKIVDLSNPRHQQILIEEIARAKRIIAEQDSMEKTYTGVEILNHPEFSDLPETRSDVDWKNRPRVYLPSLDTGDASTQIFSKSDLTGYEFEGPKMMHKIQGYLKDFEATFKETPIFVEVNDEDPRQSVDIKNPVFQAWKNNYLKAKGTMIDTWRSENPRGLD